MSIQGIILSGCFFVILSFEYETSVTTECAKDSQRAQKKLISQHGGKLP
ncbi:hypothetical protein LV84_04073 [Algoriphagus ratkowskyi]|uniref:Uncharacterized protein n=1 Tax=Algoriphagus ratkowskyi TaxID=57028 RepID=A0A2W7QP39_9BACT|nr:hypothetical protein LV84_04073 [Algoriphagus ratkowskyi]